MHNTLAITPDGLSLGFIDQQVYARKRKSKETSNKKLPIEQKESYRWLKAMQTVNQVNTGETRLITVGDRESDIYELFHFGEESHSEFVIRASWDRRLDQGRTCVKKYLWGFMRKQAVLGTMRIDIPTHHGATRTASVSLRSGRIPLKCPQRKGGAVDWKNSALRRMVKGTETSQRLKGTRMDAVDEYTLRHSGRYLRKNTVV